MDEQLLVLNEREQEKVEAQNEQTMLPIKRFMLRQW